MNDFMCFAPLTSHVACDCYSSKRLKQTNKTLQLRVCTKKWEYFTSKQYRWRDLRQMVPQGTEFKNTNAQLRQQPRRAGSCHWRANPFGSTQPILSARISKWTVNSYFNSFTPAEPRVRILRNISLFAEVSTRLRRTKLLIFGNDRMVIQAK